MKKEFSGWRCLVALFLLSIVPEGLAAGPGGDVFVIGLAPNIPLELKWVEPLGSYVGTYEITQSQYAAIMEANPSYFKNPKHPVERVSCADVMSFCARLDNKAHAIKSIPDDWSLILPTFDQWKIFVSDARLSDSVTSENGQRIGTEAVGSLKPNSFGLYDVRGNVWEFTLDRNSSFPDNAQKAGGSFSDNHIPLKGSTIDLLDIPSVLTCPPDKGYSNGGFRVILGPKK